MGELIKKYKHQKILLKLKLKISLFINCFLFGDIKIRRKWI